MVVLAVLRLLKSFLCHAILDINAIGTTSLITDEQFSVAVIQAHTRDVGMTDVAEHILQATIRGIPNLDTSRMSCDKGVEDWIVEDTEAGIFVSQMMIHRLVVVIKDQRSAADDDSLGRRCDS